MTVYSDTEFATRVLRDLGLVDADATPSASELNWATETAKAELAFLAAIKLPIWNGSDMAIPQEYLTTLSRRVALALEPSFGLSSIAQAQMAMREAERNLAIIANPYVLSPRPLKSNDAKRTRSSFNFTTGS